MVAENKPCGCKSAVLCRHVFDAAIERILTEEVRVREPWRPIMSPELADHANNVHPEPDINCDICHRIDRGIWRQYVEEFGTGMF